MFMLEPVPCVPSPVHFEEVATSASSKTLASPVVPFVLLDNDQGGGGRRDQRGNDHLDYTRYSQQQEGILQYNHQEHGLFCIKWLHFGEHVRQSLEDLRQRNVVTSSGYITFACQTNVNAFPRRWAYHKANRDILMTTSSLLRNELKTRIGHQPISLWNVSSRTMTQVIHYIKNGVVFGPIRDMNAFIKAIHVLRIGAVWPKAYAYCLAAVIGPEGDRIIRTSQHKPWVKSEENKVPEFSIARVADIRDENPLSVYERFIHKVPNTTLYPETVNEMLPQPQVSPCQQRKSVIVEASQISCHPPTKSHKLSWPPSTGLPSNTTENAGIPVTTPVILQTGSSVPPSTSSWTPQPVKSRNIYNNIFTNPNFVPKTQPTAEQYSPAYQHFREINSASLDTVNYLLQTFREAKVRMTPPAPPNTPAHYKCSPEAMIVLPTPPQSRSGTPILGQPSCVEPMPIYTSAQSHAHPNIPLNFPLAGYADMPRMPIITTPRAIRSISPATISTATQQDVLPTHTPQNNEDVIWMSPLEKQQGTGNFNQQFEEISPQPNQRPMYDKLSPPMNQPGMVVPPPHILGNNSMTTFSTQPEMPMFPSPMISGVDTQVITMLPPSVEAWRQHSCTQQATPIPTSQPKQNMPLFPHLDPRKKFMSIHVQDIMTITPPASKHRQQPLSTPSPQFSSSSPDFILTAKPRTQGSKQQERPLPSPKPSSSPSDSVLSATLTVQTSCGQARPQPPPPNLLPNLTPPPQIIPTNNPRRGRPPRKSNAQMIPSLPTNPQLMGPPPPKKFAPPIPSLRHYPQITPRATSSPAHPMSSSTHQKRIAPGSNVAASFLSQSPPRKIICPQPIPMESLELQTPALQGSAQAITRKSITNTKENHAVFQAEQCQKWRINFMQRQFLNQLYMHRQQRLLSMRSSAPVPQTNLLQIQQMAQQQSQNIAPAENYSREPSTSLQHSTPTTNQSTFYDADTTTGRHATSSTMSRYSSPPARPLCKWCGLTFCSKRVLRHHYLFVHKGKESLQNFAMNELTTGNRTGDENVKTNTFINNKSGACFHGGHIEQQVGGVFQTPSQIQQQPKPWWN